MGEIVDTLYNAKKGDFLISHKEVWEITGINAGIFLLILIKDRNNTIPIGTKTQFTRSHIKHKMVSARFFLVPKAKKSTIEVLFT